MGSTVYHSNRQALPAAQFRRANPSATAYTCLNFGQTSAGQTAQQAHLKLEQDPNAA